LRDKWYIDYYLPGGKRIREVAGHSKKLAEKLLSKRKAEILEGKYNVNKPKKISFSQLAEEFFEYSKAHAKFKSHEANENALKTLKPFFGDKLLEMITLKDIEDYRVSRLKTVKSSSTNRDLTVLKRMLNLAREWGYLNKDIARKIKKMKEPPGRVRYLSKEEILSLIKACKLPYLKTIVQIALNTGMRKGEILNLTWDQIDFNSGFIHLEKTKTGERRDIPVNKTLYEVLKDWKQDNNSDTENLFEVKDVKKSFKTALNNAGITDFRFHDLRHTFASHLVMEGVDLATISNLLGNATIQMTMRYSHLSPDHRKNAVDKMSKIIESVKMFPEYTLYKKYEIQFNGKKC